MNIPEIYLIEPYNAYAPKGRKKHWHEVIEEQALLQKILAEQQAIQEAQSKTLPANSPNISVQTVGNMSAGAGGSPIVRFFGPLPGTTVDFTGSPTTGAGPVTVNFVNLNNPQISDTFLWIFGDGTSSSLANPPAHLYDSGSTVLSNYTASLQVTFSNGTSTSSVKLGYISASKPTVSALFTFTTSSVSASATTTFVNASTNTSQTPTTTYLWVFGSGSLTSTLVNPAPLLYTAPGPYTASLQATGSYNITSSITRSWRLV